MHSCSITTPRNNGCIAGCRSRWPTESILARTTFQYICWRGTIMSGNYFPLHVFLTRGRGVAVVFVTLCVNVFAFVQLRSLFRRVNRCFARCVKTEKHVIERTSTQTPANTRTVRLCVTLQVYASFYCRFLADVDPGNSRHAHITLNKTLARR